MSNEVVKRPSDPLTQLGQWVTGRLTTSFDMGRLTCDIAGRFLMFDHGVSSAKSTLEVLVINSVSRPNENGLLHPLEVKLSRVAMRQHCSKLPAIFAEIV
jgi:hypothetical protein